MSDTGIADTPLPPLPQAPPNQHIFNVENQFTPDARFRLSSLKRVVFTPGTTRSVAIGIAGATQLRCASVEATQLGMDIGSPKSGNGPTGIKALYIAP